VTSGPRVLRLPLENQRSAVRVDDVFDLETRLRELGSAVTRIHTAVTALAGEDPAPEVRQGLELAGSHLQVFEQMQRAVREADGE
jgi:hypothetical protein